jgi:hypothetical protein
VVAVVAHKCNPGYPGDRGRRIANLRPAQAKLARILLKNKIKMKGLGM